MDGARTDWYPLEVKQTPFTCYDIRARGPWLVISRRKEGCGSTVPPSGLVSVLGSLAGTSARHEGACHAASQPGSGSRSVDLALHARRDSSCGGHLVSAVGELPKGPGGACSPTPVCTTSTSPRTSTGSCSCACSTVRTRGCLRCAAHRHWG